jgi:hypothetical protein
MNEVTIIIRIRVSKFSCQSSAHWHYFLFLASIAPSSKLKKRKLVCFNEKFCKQNNDLLWSNFWWCLSNLKGNKQILKQENETIMRKSLRGKNGKLCALIRRTCKQEMKIKMLSLWWWEWIFFYLYCSQVPGASILIWNMNFFV